MLRMGAEAFLRCFWPLALMNQALPAIEIIAVWAFGWQGLAGNCPQPLCLVVSRGVYSHSRRTRNCCISAASGEPGSAERWYDQATSGGMDSRIDSVRPPDCRPKCVPYPTPD